MNVGDILARRDGGDGTLRVAGIDAASGAILVTSATTFDEVHAVTPQSLTRHYARLQAAAPTPDVWETAVEELSA